MDLGFKGKTALVTGTALPRSLGRAIALTLAADGADVVCADIDGAGAEAIAEEVRKAGRESMSVQVDQGDYGQVKAAVQKALGRFKSIDILVNNAAFTRNFGLVHDMDVEKWRQDVEINLSGPYYFMREVFPGMIKQKYGRIVNISSITALMGSKNQICYSTCKGGLISMTRTAALEGAKYGIAVNAVAPGTIATGPMLTIDPGWLERLRMRTVLRRFADPQEIANVVAFLASDRSAYITGEIVTVDGGQHLNIM
jgi:3-oxoacyl-[acyl-carrier protein] reductase